MSYFSNHHAPKSLIYDRKKEYKLKPNAVQVKREEI